MTLMARHRNEIAKLVSAIFAGILLCLFSLWVPFVDGFYDEWQKGDLFVEIRPRALLGTVANIFNFGSSGFGILKLVSLWGWLTLIIWQIFTALTLPTKKINLYTTFVLIYLSFIFAFSTVAQMTFGPRMFIDSVPYFLVMIAYLFFVKKEGGFVWRSIFCTLLLLTAIAIHEKTIFDVAILSAYLLYKKGITKALILIGPTYIFSFIFLLFIKDRALAGESPETYFNILKKGFDFFVDYSFDLSTLLIGGGALWVLYGILCGFFILTSPNSREKRYRVVLIIVMLLGCFAPLLVAWDTNRLVGLIWLPTIVLIVETGGLIFIKPNKIQFITLFLLCFLQLAVPPILRYPNMIVAYNSYAKYIYGEKAVIMMPPIHKGDFLYFKDQSNGSAYLRNGWNGPESWGVWSREKDSTIIIDAIRDPSITYLIIDFKAMASDKLPQYLTVFINNQLVSESTITKMNGNMIKLMIPKKTDGEMYLRFNLSNPTTPIALGISADDGRLLGIGLLSIQFE